MNGVLSLKKMEIIRGPWPLLQYFCSSTLCSISSLFFGVLIHMAFQNGLDLDSNPTNTFMLHDSLPLPGGSAKISALRL